MKIEHESPETVVKRALWLAWQACGSPSGMGWFQNNPSACEEDVWQNALRRGDYPGAPTQGSGEVHADYVFGRMMKLRIKWDATSIDVREDAPRPDYQSWCVTYPTYQSLFEAAIASL